MRKEYKYLVPVSRLNFLRTKLMPYLLLDAFAGSRDDNEYTVRSIYFDTHDMEFYREKIEGIKIRKKFRIRGYNTLIDNKMIYLEIKRKYENFNYKNRSPLLFSDLQDLFRTGKVEDYILTKTKSDKAVKDANHFFYYYNSKSLVPTVLVVYEREAFFCRFDKKIRITFDKNLRFEAYPCLSGLYNDDKLQYAIADYFILEIKFDQAFPLWLQNIIRDCAVSRKAVSKYTTCLDRHHKYYPVSGTTKYMMRGTPYKSLSE